MPGEGQGPSLQKSGDVVGPEPSRGIFWMVRAVLPNRRSSVTTKIHVELDNGREVKLLVTIGFDQNGDPAEVFCANFKTGTALHAIVMDACILFSRLLQHGDRPSDLARSMCQPHSMVGAIASAVAEFERPIEGEEPKPALPRTGPVSPAGEFVELTLT